MMSSQAHYFEIFITAFSFGTTTGINLSAGGDGQFPDLKKRRQIGNSVSDEWRRRYLAH